MHELPKDLTNSLRSWRGSIYDKANNQHNPPNDPATIELQDHGGEDYGEKRLEPVMTAKASSLILHPTKSHQALNKNNQQSASQDVLSNNDAHQQTGASQSALPPHNQSAVSPTKSLFSGPLVKDPDAAADRLESSTTPLTGPDFYEIIGMKPPISKHQNPRDLVIQHGLYGRIYHQLKYTQTKYRTFDVVIYVFLALQLVLSAVFIILGSLTKLDSHIAIAVLGAVSTVITGILAMMKGQGLPNRLRQTRDGLRNVAFEAEELYWDVGAGRSVFYKDVQKVREDYLRVMEEARKNHPDTWNSSGTAAILGLQSGGKGKQARITVPDVTPKAR